jgi:DNA-binding GntR family transcriptional regulator
MSIPVRAERAQSPYERIKDAIVNGEIAPGAPLVEVALAEWCEVSRTPIREALTRLEQDGVVVRGERGLIVRERSQQEILDLYDTRIVLEATAARIAAVRRTELDMIHIQRLGDAFAGVSKRDPKEMARLNREFHRTI